MRQQNQHLERDDKDTSTQLHLYHHHGSSVCFVSARLSESYDILITDGYAQEFDRQDSTHELNMLSLNEHADCSTKPTSRQIMRCFIFTFLDKCECWNSSQNQPQWGHGSTVFAAHEKERIRPYTRPFADPLHAPICCRRTAHLIG